MKRFWISALFLFLLTSFVSTSRLFAQAPAPSATPTNPWLDQLKSPDEKTRGKAARELGKSNDAAVIPALAAALTDPSDKVRREVVIALAQIHQPESLDGLITAAKDSDPDVRVAAAQSLVGYYTGVVPSPGFTGYVKKQWRRAKSHFVQDNSRIDPGLKVEPKVIAALDNAMLDTGSIQAAREAAKGLGILVAPTVVPDLVKSAHSSDEDLARESLNALAKIKEKSAGTQLIDLLDSPDKDVRRDACVTLGVLRTKDALPKLQSMFENDPDLKTKEKALEGLAYLGEPASVPVFTKSLWSDNKQMRISAADGLARAGDPKNVAEIEKRLAVENDASTKLALQFAITALGKDDHLAAIAAELSSKFRGEDAQTYLIELSRDKKFLPKLYPYLSSQDAGVRRRLCTVLMFTGDQSSMEHLERVSHDPNGEVASEALRAMRAIRVRAPASAPVPAPASNPTP
jgi:HEAT repeat protein